MAERFCCAEIKPYRPQRLTHEPKFKAFMEWATYPKASSYDSTGIRIEKFSTINPPFAIHMVRQVNYGPIESKRYFIRDGEQFVEVSERDLIEANWEKLNAYKNWKCEVHNKFFETNVYQKNPVNVHHWRANIARPATEVDI